MALALRRSAGPLRRGKDDGCFDCRVLRLPCHWMSTLLQLSRTLHLSYPDTRRRHLIFHATGGTYPGTKVWYYGNYGTFGMHNSDASNAQASPVDVGPYATALVKGDPPARPYVDLRRPLYLCTPKKKSSTYPRPFLSTSGVCENLLSSSQRTVQRIGYIAVHKVPSGQPRPLYPTCAKPQH